jgi:hypothetical protein
MIDGIDIISKIKINKKQSFKFVIIVCHFAQQYYILFTIVKVITVDSRLSESRFTETKGNFISAVLTETIYTKLRIIRNLHVHFLELIKISFLWELTSESHFRSNRNAF